MRLLSTLFSFIILGHICLAQTATISDGIDLKQEDQFDLVGQVGESLFVIKDKTEGSSIYIFDERMKLRYTKEIDLPRKRHQLLGTVTNPEYFGAVFQYKQKGQSIVQVLKFDEAGELIDSATVKTYSKRPFAPIPVLVQSQDRTKLAIWNDEEEDLIEMTSFDLQLMEPIWDDRISTGVLSTRKDLFQVIMDNEGSTYAIFSKDNLRAKKIKNRFTILRRTKAGRESVNVNLEGNLIFDSYFDIDNINNKITAVGLYDDKRTSRVKGSYFLSIPLRTPDSFTLTFNPFPTSTMGTIIGKEADETSTFTDASVTELILRTDGGAVLVIEKQRINKLTYDPAFPRSAPARGSSLTPTNRAEFHYDDIILASYTPSGKVEWEDILYKRQFSRDDGGIQSSFFIMKNPKGIRFIYNDEIKNNTSVSEYTLNRKGDTERKNVLDTGGYNIKLLFKNGRQVNRNDIIIPSIRKRTLKLVRIRYK